MGVLLCAAAPVGVSAGSTFPLDQNLVTNPGFELGPPGDTAPGWEVIGDLHVRTFGATFPQQSYADRYDGGRQYLDCGKRAGLVRQTIELTGRALMPKQLKARIKVDLGGASGHISRAILRVIGSNEDIVSQTTRPLTVTNHYQNVVATVLVPYGSERIEATLELAPKAGATQCKIMADNVRLWIFQP
jgi:hypothetical protein